MGNEDVHARCSTETFERQCDTVTRLALAMQQEQELPQQELPQKCLRFDTFCNAKEAVMSRSWPQSRVLPVESLRLSGGRCEVNSMPVTMLDVRSPAEFAQGHIPGAISVPLLDDDSRAEVGRLFRISGADEAFDTALQRAYPGLQTLLGDSVRYSSQSAGRTAVLVYCKRGGLRSQSVATFLAGNGLDVYTIQGGYKAFRNWAAEMLRQPRHVCVLGGFTGSGKTEILTELGRQGQQVIDLEAIACHKGSVFGHLGESPQPSSEQVRNTVAIEWSNFDPSKFIFIEDEHSFIGDVCLDASLYQRMRSPELVVRIEVPMELRVDRIVRDYVAHGQDKLAAAVQQFRKRMGGQETDRLLDCINSGDYHTVSRTALQLYDASYERHLFKGRSGTKFSTVHLDSLDSREAASKVVEAVQVFEVESREA